MCIRGCLNKHKYTFFKVHACKTNKNLGVSGNLERVGKIKRLFGEPQGQVITLRVFFFDEPHPRVYIQNVSVCTGKTPTCFIHVDVLPVHMGGRFECTHGGGFFQRATPHTHHNSTTEDETEDEREDEREQMRETEMRR